MIHLILLLFYSLLIFSCSSTAVVDEDSFVLETKTEYEDIECEEEDIPCDELSEWAYEYYEEGDFEESINTAKQAIVCNCAISNAGKIYSSLAKSYAELGKENNKISSAIKKGLSYDPEILI